MSLWKVEGLLVEIDDELFAHHDGDQAAPPNDTTEWYGGDLHKALEDGIATLIHDEIEMEPVEEDEA